jgi:hypothetical protein
MRKRSGRESGAGSVLNGHGSVSTSRSASVSRRSYRVAGVRPGTSNIQNRPCVSVMVPGTLRFPTSRRGGCSWAVLNEAAATASPRKSRRLRGPRFNSTSLVSGRPRKLRGHRADWYSLKADPALCRSPPEQRSSAWPICGALRLPTWSMFSSALLSPDNALADSARLSAKAVYTRVSRYPNVYVATAPMDVRREK